MAGAGARRQRRDRKNGDSSSNGNDNGDDRESPKTSSTSSSSPPQNPSPPAGFDGNRDPATGPTGSAAAPPIPDNTEAQRKTRNMDLGLQASFMINQLPFKGCPKRPDTLNNSGQPVLVTLNNFLVKTLPEKKPVYQYDVIFFGENMKRGLQKKIWNSRTVQNLTEKSFIWDGSKLAWSLIKLNETNTRVEVDLDEERRLDESSSGSDSGDSPKGKGAGKPKPKAKPAEQGKGKAKAKDDDGDDGDDGNGGSSSSPGSKRNCFKFELKFTKQVRFDQFHAYLNKQADWNNNCLEAQTFMDHLMRERPSQKYTTIKRNFFARGEERFLLGDGVEAFKGVYATIGPVFPALGQPARMGVTVDVANTAFWTHSNLIDTVQRLCGIQMTEEIPTLLKPERPNIWKMARRIARLGVYTKHRGTKIFDQYVVRGLLNQNSRQYKIENFRDPKTDKVSDITLEQYFMRKYNIKLTWPQFPVVQMTKQKIVMPIELCWVTENQRYPYKLTDRQTTQMLNFAVTLPKGRWNSIEHGLSMLDWRNDRYLATYGLSISQEPQKVTGRVLPPPKIEFKDKGGALTPGTSGRWKLENKVFFESNVVPLNAWGVGFHLGRGGPNQQQVQAFIDTFVKVYTKHGGVIPNPKPVIYPIRQRDAAQAAQELWNATGNSKNQRPQMLMFIVNDRDSDYYKNLKHACDTKYGVASQVMQSKHVMKNNLQYHSNVCMKVNAKLGGCTGKSVSTMRATWFGRPTMILGADVSHGSPGASGVDAASIAAITMSCDKIMVKYWARVETNGERAEMIVRENWDKLFAPMLERWAKVLNTMPHHIIYLRDGVSQSQYSQVVEYELSNIKRVVDSQMPKNTTQYTVLTCTKRHHVRFFPQRGDINNNPLPGTLVELGVTHPFEYDFYLCAHSAIKGTARPVHYYVLYDDARMQGPALQNMIYEHSYQYVRSSTPVSLHPAIYYAHLAAARATAHYDRAAAQASQQDKKKPSRHEESESQADNRPLTPFKNDAGLAERMWYV